MRVYLELLNWYTNIPLELFQTMKTFSYDWEKKCHKLIEVECKITFTCYSRWAVSYELITTFCPLISALPAAP